MSDKKYKELLTAHGIDATKRRKNAEILADLVEEALAPKSAIDIGCGAGFLISALRGRGVEVLGVDGHWIDEVDLEAPRECFQVHDLRQPYAQDRRWDMSSCLEVGEHLPRGRAEGLVEDLCALSDAVMFSAAIPNQGGVGHINEQWQSYWAELFAARGYDTFDAFRPLLVGQRDAFSWFRQNLLLFLKSGSAAATRLADHRIPPKRSSFILPEMHERILKRMLDRKGAKQGA